MKTIYIESDFHCHVDPIGNPVETDVFDGKCDAFVEGCMFVPEGNVWIRSDGEEFPGPWHGAWKPYSELDSAQREYEKQKLENCLEALQELGVEV